MKTLAATEGSFPDQADLAPKLDCIHIVRQPRHLGKGGVFGFCG
jgi:hypothetical protein